MWWRGEGASPGLGVGSRCEKNVLLDDGVLKHGEIRVGFFVSDLQSFVLHMPKEQVCLVFASKLERICSRAVLPDEVGVLERHKELSRIWHWLDATAVDASLGCGPSKSETLVAPLLPPAQEYGDRGGDPKDDMLDEQGVGGETHARNCSTSRAGAEAF